MNEEAENREVVLDENRIDELTEIGVIDGGEFFDVLAVAYGDELILRIRNERNGYSFAIRPKSSLEEALAKFVAEALPLFWPEFPYTPRPTIYRGPQAKEWVTRLLDNARAAAPSVGNSKRARLIVDVYDNDDDDQ